MIAALVNHLWQSTLFALGPALLALALRRSGAGVRYGLWLAASIKFLIPFALLAAAGGAVVARLHLLVAPPQGIAVIAPIVEPMAQEPLMIAPAAIPAQAAASVHAAALPFDPAPLLAAVWALGAVVLLALWTVRWSRVRAALRVASPIDMPAEVPVLSSPTLLEPGVVGVLRPVLVLPEGIAERLSPAEFQAVVAHEFCHVRRRDNLTGMVHMLVQALFWFHPLVWWLGARLVDERERACDEAVIRAGHDRDAYARGILETCRLYLQSPLVCVAGASGSNLQQRVEAIMTRPLSVPLPLAVKMALGAVGAVALASPVAAGILAAPQVADLVQLRPAPLQAAPARTTAAVPQARPAEPVADTLPAAPPKPMVLAEAAAPAASPAPAAPSPEETARLLAEQEQPRQMIPFDPAHFDRYVGYYQLAPGVVFTVLRDGSKLLIQLTGQSAVQVYPESETKFFATIVPAQFSFTVDSEGRANNLTLHQNGREQPAPRIDDAQAKALATARAQRMVSNTPAPGTADFLRRYLASAEAGAVDYSQMAPSLVQAALAQRDRLASDIKTWGPVQSIRFSGVVPQGMDRYIVTFQNATFPILVGPPGADGKFAGLLLQPGAGNPTPSPEVEARIAANRPSPGTEAYLRQYLVSASKGQPDYSGMSSSLATGAREQWPTRGPIIVSRGALKSLTFLRVSPEGYDVYDAVYEHAEVLWTVGPIGPDHKESYASGIPLFEGRPG